MFSQVESHQELHHKAVLLYLMDSYVSLSSSIKFTDISKINWPF